MYTILRIQYVHYTPDSVVQYTPKYSLPQKQQIAQGAIWVTIIRFF